MPHSTLVLLSVIQYKKNIAGAMKLYNAAFKWKPFATSFAWRYSFFSFVWLKFLDSLISKALVSFASE